MFYLHEDDPIIKTHEAILDLCTGRSSDFNILDNFPPEMFDLDIFDHDRSLTETIHYYGDGRDSKQHCGNFLDTGHTRSRQFHQRHLLLAPGKTGFKEITQEESDKIAKELVKEEERLKEKAEKKRLKKQKQAEKKQLEKLNGIKDKNSPVSDPLDGTEQEQNARHNSSPSQAQTQNVHTKAPPSQAQTQNVHTKAPPSQAQTQKVNTKAPPSQAQTQNVHIKAPPSQAQTQNVHIKAPPSQAQTQNVHIKAPPSQAQTQKVNTKAPPSQAQTQNVHIKAPPSQAQTQNVHIKAPPSQAQTQNVHIKAPPSQAQTQKVNTKAPPSQAQTQKVNTKAPPSQAQTQKVNTKAPPSQAQTQNVRSNRLCEEVDEEEDLDMSSCFVSKAASIAKRKMAVQQKLAKEKKKGSVNLPQAKAEVAPPGVKEDQQQNGALTSPEDILRRSMDMAALGNQFAASGQFEMAVKYFTEAIKCNPKEFRMFGNRAFCFEKLQQYEKALSDADVTLDMSPGWIKGLYRKGRALAGLKRYSEAVMAFKEVLIQDSSCTDAAQELMRVQIMQLMELGFSREQSANALVIHGTLENVLEAFRHQPGCFGGLGLPVAEEEQRTPVQRAPIAPHPHPYPHPHPQPKPTAPVRSSPVPNQAQLELFPVWVGNLVSSVTDAMIRDLFRTIGEVHSVKVLQNRRCAFVNYTRRVDSARAVQEFNGKPFEGSVLLVRYPDKFQSHIPMSKSALTEPPVSSSVNVVNMRKLNEECFFYRTTSCSHRNCMYIHVPEHRGIDQDKSKTVP